MKDNSDLPLASDQLKSKVLVFAIVDEATHQYEQITKGYVELNTDQDQKNNTFHYLEVKDQETNQLLMRSNLKLQNNFGKQKGSIISWTDQQQPQYQDLAISFEKQTQCEMFWRVICQKIGKSYLEINGTEKLELPNANNLSYILQKTKNSVQLIDYNIAHENSMMAALRQVFQQMKESNDQMGMGTIVRIINSIMSPTYSSGTIQALLMNDNFKFLLEVQEYKKGIKFTHVYETSIGQHLKNRFHLPQEIFEKVQVSHRAVFYRENVLNLIEDSLLESMMLMIAKQAQVEILSYLNRSKFLQTVVIANDYRNGSQKKNGTNQINDDQETKLNEKQSKSQISPSQLIDEKINFIHQSLILYQQISSEQIKATFKENIYSQPNLLPFIQAQIDNNSLKALELLQYIIEIDKLKFFDYLIQQFKSDSNNNLLKILIKKYLNNNKFAKPILFIIESLSPLFNENKQLFDFFMGTFVISVLSLTKQTQQALYLINNLLWNLGNSSPIFSQIVKSKICEKIATQYRSGSNLKSKPQELQIVKMLKYILIEQARKEQSRDQEIEKTLIQSGFLECCMMIYLKHSMRFNLICSSMLENFKILQKIPYSKIHKWLIQEYSSNQGLLNILKPIQQKYIEFQKKNQNHETKISETQQFIHNTILENEHQDDYLMKEDIQTIKVQQVTTAGPNQKSSQISTKQLENQNTKDENLLIFKRIMNQITDLNEESLLNENKKRKEVKKQHQISFGSIQIQLELPQMDEI